MEGPNPATPCELQPFWESHPICPVGPRNEALWRHLGSVYFEEGSLPHQNLLEETSTKIHGLGNVGRTPSLKYPFGSFSSWAAQGVLWSPFTHSWWRAADGRLLSGTHPAEQRQAMVRSTGESWRVRFRSSHHER